MKVLIIKTSSMGDLIHTLPALTDATKAIPDIQFDWVAEEGFAEIPTWHPAVNKVIPFALRRWKKNVAKSFVSGDVNQFMNALKATEYDYVIDAQGLLKSAGIARFAQGTLCGMGFTSAREAAASFFYDKKYNVAKNLHAIERVRSLFAQVLGYQYAKDSLDYGLFTSQFTTHLTQKPYVVFLHSTSRDSKLWPEQQWQALINKATAEGYNVFLPWGNTQEYERAERLSAEKAQCHVLPKMTLTEIAGVLVNTAGVVGVDTGLMHLAAALSVPSVALYVDTYPGLTGACGLNQTCLTQMESSRDFVKTVGLTTNYYAEIEAETVWQTLQGKLNFLRH